MIEIVEREVPCLRCKGIGEVMDGLDVYCAVFTLGLSLLVGKSPCPKCDGTGKQWMRERIVEGATTTRENE